MRSRASAAARRRKIRKTLTAKRDDQTGKTDNTEESEGKEGQVATEQEPSEPALSSAAERIRDIGKQVVGLELNSEEKQKILKKTREIREGLKRG